MRNRTQVWACVFALAATNIFGAAALPPEKLLPKDTLAVVTAPDTRKFLELATNSATGRFWRAPEMKAFREKFTDKFKEAVSDPLEKELGLKVDDLNNLAQGQTTLAIFANDPASGADKFSPTLIMDTKDHADELKKTLERIKKKWADAGKEMKSEKIHDFEFTTYISEAAPPPAAKPDDANGSDNAADGNTTPPAPKKTAVVIGQVDSLMILSSSRASIEKILSRRSGGLTPPLEEQPAFAADFNARLRAAPCYAWVNAKALTDIIAKGAEDDPGSPTGFSVPTIMTMTGLNDITSAAVTLQSDSEGTRMDLHVAVPEANRRGLIKAFTLEAKDCAPPSFVPADAVKFVRWRVDMHKAWTTLEQMLNDINPNMANAVNFVLSSAGKDKDASYDLKAELLNNAGDDVISYAKAPTGTSLEDYKAAPGLVLVGSPNPDKLAAAIKVALEGPLTAQTGGIKEQEFLGRKIFSAQLPGQKGATTPFSFAASGSYMAFAGKSDMVEEFLRSDEGKGKPLKDTEGLAGAAQKVGGMETGFFEFDNFYASMKSVFDLAHAQNVTLSDLTGGAAAPGVNPAQQLGKLKEWADFSLLPPFDAVSKYFYFTVQSVRFSADGFSWDVFAPTPPKMK